MFPPSVTVVKPHVAAPVWLLPAFDVVGGAFTTTFALAVDAVHGELLIVHTKAYVPAPPDGVKVVVGLLVLVNCEVLVLGPLEILHAPVPIVAVFPERTWFPVLHIVPAEPFVAVVGFLLKVTFTVEEEAVQGELLIVHCNV